MAVSLSSLAPATTAATALSNLILVTPNSNLGYQPQNVPNADGSESTAEQPPAILFHYEGEQTASMESDITDHFVENNTAIQDQIALKPQTVTTHGFIGELNDVPPPALALLKSAADKLTAITAYAPQVSTTAQIAYDEAFLLYQTAGNAVDAAVSAWSSLTGGETQNKQQEVFKLFSGYWSNRTLFTVQTPWRVYKNMAIQHLRAIQDSETRMITDFEVTFKEIRTARVLRSQTDPVLLGLQAQAAAQGAPLDFLGTNQAAPVDAPTVASTTASTSVSG